MGNWRTVRMEGSCPKEQVEALLDATRFDWDGPRNANYGPLAWMESGGGLCGIGKWAKQTIFEHGNLFERDFTVEDISEELRRLVTVAPGLRLKIHCGGEYEDQACIATITAENGQVEVSSPEIESVGGFDEDKMLGRFLRATRRSTTQDLDRMIEAAKEE